MQILNRADLVEAGFVSKENSTLRISSGISIQEREHI